MGININHTKAIGELVNAEISYNESMREKGVEKARKKEYQDLEYIQSNIDRLNNRVKSYQGIDPKGLQVNKYA